jgi:hypothetical protein
VTSRRANINVFKDVGIALAFRQPDQLISSPSSILRPGPSRLSENIDRQLAHSGSRRPQQLQARFNDKT